MKKMIVLAAVFTACSSAVGEIAEPTTSSVETDSTDVSTTAEEPTTGTDSTTPASDAPSTTRSDRPLAPDFTLSLGDGGSYTLSSSAKPVYMIFWAEW